MAVQPTIWDQANLQQVTQGGGALLDYLNHNRSVEDENRQAATKLNSALQLKQAENQGGVQRVEAAGRLQAVQGDLNRKNALDVVGAQEHARVAAARAASISGLQARYPRKADETDDEYIERVGKTQAIGPNKIYKQMLLKQESTDRKAKELEDSVEKLWADETQRRAPKILAAARSDIDLIAAAKQAGYDKVPASIPNAIAMMRAKKMDSKADELEAAWTNAMTRADDQKVVPYSPELSVKLKDVRDQIQRVKISGDREQERLHKDRLELMNGKYFNGGNYLEHGEADAPSALSPLGPPANLAPARVAPDASGRKTALQEYLDGAPTTAAAPSTPGMQGVIPDAVRAVGTGARALVSGGSDVMDNINTLMPSRSDVAPLAAATTDTLSGIGSAADAARRFLVRGPGEAAPQVQDPLTMYLGGMQGALGAAGRTVSGGMQAVANPVGETLQGLASYVQPASWNNDPSPLPLPVVARVKRLFGADAPTLLDKAKALGISRGMSKEEQSATFNKALNGDPQAIAGVKRVLDYLRQERDNPIQDEPAYPMLSPVTPGNLALPPQ